MFLIYKNRRQKSRRDAYFFTKNIDPKHVTVKFSKMSHINLFGFWLFATSMFVFSVLNLLILLSIVSVLKMGPSTGLEFFEFISTPKSVTKFFGDVDFDKIFLRQSLIESFQDQPIEITSTAEDNSNFR